MFSLSPASDKEFDAFALAHPCGNFHQTSQMTAFRNALGWETHQLLLKKKSITCGALVLAGKLGRYEVTLGPLIDFDDKAASAALLTLAAEYVKNIGGHTVDFYPNDLYQLRGTDGTIEHTSTSKLLSRFLKAGWKHKGFTVDYDHTVNRWMFVKDLTGINDEKELLASYRESTRRTIKKLPKDRYSIRTMDYSELDVVKKLMDSSNDRNGVPNRDLKYYQELHKNFGDLVEFLVVFDPDNTPLSTAVLISHPKELVYLASGTDSKYRNLYGGHFLQHYIMSRCITRGITRYNLYGVTGHFANNSLLVYKGGFRGHVEEYFGGFTLVVDARKRFTERVVRIQKKIAHKIGR